MGGPLSGGGFATPIVLLCNKQLSLKLKAIIRSERGKYSIIVCVLPHKKESFVFTGLLSRGDRGITYSDWEASTKVCLRSKTLKCGHASSHLQFNMVGWVIVFVCTCVVCIWFCECFV